MIKHGRAYTDAGEKQRRFDVYRKNVELIEEFNSGSNSYTLTDNKFADLTNEEFRAKVLGLGAPRREELVHVSFLSLGLLHMFYSSGS
jgi:hypothetical protein